MTTDRVDRVVVSMPELMLHSSDRVVFEEEVRLIGASHPSGADPFLLMRSPCGLWRWVRAG